MELICFIIFFVSTIGIYLIGHDLLIDSNRHFWQKEIPPCADCKHLVVKRNSYCAHRCKLVRNEVSGEYSPCGEVRYREHCNFDPKVD